MGVWDSIKGGVGAAWDQTGGRAWDAYSDSPFWDPDTPKYSEAYFDYQPAPHTRGGRMVGGISDLLGNVLKLGEYANPMYLPRASRQVDRWLWEDTTEGSEVAAGSDAELDLSPEAFDALLAAGAPPIVEQPFTRPDFDPSAITGPYGAFADASGAALGAYTSAADEAYETYKGLLEGIATGPRTSRIEEMYRLATEEARRRGESADAWEATQGERLESDFAAREERLGGLHEEFNTELDLIREASGERREGAKVEREARIDQVIADADLGEAAATFIVSSTATSDILDSQGTRQEAYDGRMDRLYAGVELDRVMALAGLESDARRDLADDVLAMKELVADFRYNAGQAFQEQMFTAEENAYQREVDMTTALAELGYGHAGRMAELGYGHAGEMADIGLQGALAVAGAEDAFDTQWDEVEAYLGNPVTANAFEGMDPSLMGGAPPQQMFENWLDVLGMEDSGPSMGAPGDPVYWQDEQGSWWEIGTYGPVGQIVYDHAAISGISNPRGLSPEQLLLEIQRGILV